MKCPPLHGFLFLVSEFFYGDHFAGKGHQRWLFKKVSLERCMGENMLFSCNSFLLKGQVNLPGWRLGEKQFGFLVVLFFVICLALGQHLYSLFDFSSMVAVHEEQPVMGNLLKLLTREEQDSGGSKIDIFLDFESKFYWDNQYSIVFLHHHFKMTASVK